MNEQHNHGGKIARKAAFLACMATCAAFGAAIGVSMLVLHLADDVIESIRLSWIQGLTAFGVLIVFFTAYCLAEWRARRRKHLKEMERVRSEHERARR